MLSTYYIVAVFYNDGSKYELKRAIQEELLVSDLLKLGILKEISEKAGSDVSITVIVQIILLKPKRIV